MRPSSDVGLLRCSVAYRQQAERDRADELGNGDGAGHDVVDGDARPARIKLRRTRS